MEAGGILPSDEAEGDEEQDPWGEVWDKVDDGVKRCFGRGLNAEDMDNVESTPGGWEGAHYRHPHLHPKHDNQHLHHHHHHHHHHLILSNEDFFPVLYIDANNLYGSVQTQRYVDLIIIIIFTNQKNHMIIIIIIVNA